MFTLYKDQGPFWVRRGATFPDMWERLTLNLKRLRLLLVYRSLQVYMGLTVIFYPFVGVSLDLFS